jgi:hypothetical protein
MPKIKCRVCDRSFYVKPCHLKLGWGKYCSRQCASKSQLKGQHVYCSICKKILYRAPVYLKRSKSGKYFCSKSCQTLWRNSYFVGEMHPNWHDGQGSYREILKRSGKKAVCVSCKTKDERVLSVHHIDHNRHNNYESNLVWVCFNCHFLIHHDEKIEKGLFNGMIRG